VVTANAPTASVSDEPTVALSESRCQLNVRGCRASGLGVRIHDPSGWATALIVPVDGVAHPAVTFAVCETSCPQVFVTVTEYSVVVVGLTVIDAVVPAAAEWVMSHH
jgi:hypothetical protein